MKKKKKKIFQISDFAFEIIQLNLEYFFYKTKNNENI